MVLRTILMISFSQRIAGLPLLRYWLYDINLVFAQFSFSPHFLAMWSAYLKFSCIMVYSTSFTPVLIFIPHFLTLTFNFFPNILHSMFICVFFIFRVYFIAVAQDCDAYTRIGVMQLSSILTFLLIFILL